jgi:hypothetical protein
MARLARLGGARPGWLTLGRALAVLAGILLAVVYGGAGASSTPNPPGNNGTIKVDGVAFDDHPDNEPHVGCIFQVDFYGFDEGDLFADVTFEVHPPTGNPEVILEDVVFIGENTLCFTSAPCAPSALMVSLTCQPCWGCGSNPSRGPGGTALLAIR